MAFMTDFLKQKNMSLEEGAAAGGGVGGAPVAQQDESCCCLLWAGCRFPHPTPTQPRAVDLLEEVISDDEGEGRKSGKGKGNKGKKRKQQEAPKT